MTYHRVYNVKRFYENMTCYTPMRKEAAAIERKVKYAIPPYHGPRLP